jgi:hypothetical protein
MRIPVLDLGKIQHSKKDSAPLECEKSNRSLFDRHSFQEFSNKVNMNDFDLNLYPEMLRMREEGIHCRQ